MNSAPIAADEFALALAQCAVKPDTKIAVAVSGGPDSMALLLLLQKWDKSRIFAVTVDHDLRADSATEAAQIAQWCEQLGILHTILKWQHDQPKTGIMAAARQARYDLLGDWCRSQNIYYLTVGHHRDDQAETVLMRLAKGSGLDGLGGMRRAKQLQNVTLIRPLLDFSKDRLVATCQDHGQEFFADPSNHNEKFARARLRNVMNALADEGLSTDRLIDLAERAASAADALSWLTDQALTACYDQGARILDWPKLQAYPADIQERAVKSVLMAIGGENYPPRRAQLLALLQALPQLDFKGRTLHQCVITRKKDGTFYFYAEPKQEVTD